MKTNLAACAILLLPQLLCVAPAGAQGASAATPSPAAAPPAAAPPAATEPVAAPGAESGLQLVERLGLLNGQALACNAAAAVTRARQLMLTHAPRTPQYGGAFEQATQAGFRLQITAKSPCPSPAELNLSMHRAGRARAARGPARRMSDRAPRDRSSAAFARALLAGVLLLQATPAPARGAGPQDAPAASAAPAAPGATAAPAAAAGTAAADATTAADATDAAADPDRALDSRYLLLDALRRA
ncbi:MAG: hypothetical protein U1F11_11095 [Steroidobacteraceae bacterium]